MDICRVRDLLKDIDSLNLQRVDAVRKYQNVPASLDKLYTIIDQEKEEIQALQSTFATQEEIFKRMDHDLKAIETRLNDSQTKLTSITQQEEYQAGLKEVDAYKTQLVQRQSQIESESERLSIIKATIDEQARVLTEHEKAAGELKAQVDIVISKLQKHADGIIKNISKIESELPNNIQSLIKKLDQQQVIPFTAEATEAHVCAQCHMSFPPQLILSALANHEMAQCPHCFRILLPGDWAF